MMMDVETRTTSQASPPSRPLKKAIGWGLSLLAVAGGCGLIAWLNHSTPQRAAARPVWFEAHDKNTTANDSHVATPVMHTTNQPAPKAVATPISAEDKARALGQLARVDRVLRDYRRVYGEFPIGSNVDITRALQGDNPKKIIFVTPDEAPISTRGELIDAWQTPYFFHQLSGTQMEIFSPGPDRQMWTVDDLKVTAQ